MTAPEQTPETDFSTAQCYPPSGFSGLLLSCVPNVTPRERQFAQPNWWEARNAAPRESDESRRCKARLAELVEVIVATRNVDHLGRFVDARERDTIPADRTGGLPLP